MCLLSGMARRRRQLLRSGLIAVALLGLAIAIIHWLILPAVARAQVRSAFRHLGAPVASFEIERTSLAGLRLTGVRLGERPWLTAAVVDVHYNLNAIWTGRLRSIEVHDLQWTVSRNDHQVDLGFAFQRRDSGHDRIDLPFERLIVRRGAVRLQGFGELDGAEFDLNIARRPEGADARVDIRHINVSDAALPGPQVVAELKGSLISAAADWEIVESEPIRLRADVAIDDGGLNGEIVADMPPVELNDLGRVRSLISGLREFELGGTWSGRARLAFGDGGMKSHIRLSARRASLAREGWPVNVASFNGDFTIDSLNPFLMTQKQRLEVDEASWGQLPIDNGIIEFSVPEPQTLSIARADWSMAGYGQFTAQPFEIALDGPQFATRISMADLELEDWLTLLSDGRVRGYGRLQGWADVAYPPQARRGAFVGSGMLRAQSDGWIETADRDLVERVIAGSDAFLAPDPRLNEVRDRLVAALQDFAFSRLVIELVSQPDGVSARVETTGVGRTGPQPQEVDLNLNMNGFDQLVNAAIQGRSLWESVE